MSVISSYLSSVLVWIRLNQFDDNSFECFVGSVWVRFADHQFAYSDQILSFMPLQRIVDVHAPVHPEFGMKGKPEQTPFLKEPRRGGNEVPEVEEGVRESRPVR